MSLTTNKSLKETATNGATTDVAAANNVNENGVKKDNSNVDTTSSNDATSDKDNVKNIDSASTSGDRAETSRGDKIDRPLSPRKSSSSSDSEASFSWKDYLKETTSTPAPPSCFKQSPDPPDNEFVVGAKMEAQVSFDWSIIATF